MSNKEKADFSIGEKYVIDPIPLDKRMHWASPAIVYAGCEFAITTLMAGSGLVASYSISRLFWIVFIGFIITWIGNSVTSYLGATTGRTSSVIARSSYGTTQARIIVALSIAVVMGGWWALQTAVAGNAISAMVGIDYTTQKVPWAIITIICGIIFAIPSILGYTSMAWTDYIAVPGGLIILIWAFVLAVKDMGWSGIMAWNPSQTISWTEATSMILGLNTCQWLMISDYSRFCKPKAKDNILMSIGIVIVGIVLVMMGGILGVGKGDFDIVKIMVDFGFPVQGFIILFLAQWTSQLVNNYSLGLALCNMFNVESNKGRMKMTIFGTLVGIIIALAGILDQFTNLLYLFAILFPPIAAVMIVDYFLLRDQEWEEIEGWNIVATISFVIGGLVGYYTQYVNIMGIPAVQSWIVSAIAYYLLMYLKAKTKPDKFTPKKWLEVAKESV